jgi:pantoate--beta-alanine ligase
MRILRSVVEMQREAERLRLAGKKIGFVPTMGYLHAGHMSLVEYAKSATDVAVLSIFVNPTQFGPNEDFAKYPRDFDKDKALAERAGVEILFHPANTEMYGKDFGTYVEEQEASRILEGMIRPGHFRGVTTVLAKLLNICKPHVAVFGQKDAQQAFVVKKMVKDLNLDVSVFVVPTARETDGLAMSSRNVYLTKQERSEAIALFQSLTMAEEKIKGGEQNAFRLRQEMESLIRSKGSPTIDYVAFVDPASFREIDTVTESTVLVAVAARYGTTRLIDNVIVGVR